jgi:predicted RecB family nuclease
MAKKQLLQEDYDHLINSFATQLWFLRERWKGIKTLREAILEDIVNYNEDDVRATEHLLFFLSRRG